MHLCQLCKWEGVTEGGYRIGVGGAGVGEAGVGAEGGSKVY